MNAKRGGGTLAPDTASVTALVGSFGVGADGAGVGAEAVAGMIGVKPKVTGAEGAGLDSVGAEALTGGKRGFTSGQL